MNRANRRPIVILISGRGSNMRALIERSREPDAAFEVVEVFSDQPHAAGLDGARSLGVPARPVRPEDALSDAILAASPELIVLAGYMRILSAAFVARFRGKIMNIHPSLLPRHPGLHTHRRVLEAREEEHGATVHFVTEQLDAGPAIIQARIGVNPDDDEASLAARVQREEHRIYPLAVQWYCSGRLRYQDGRAWLDGKAMEKPAQ